MKRSPQLSLLAHASDDEEESQKRLRPEPVRRSLLTALKSAPEGDSRSPLF